MILSDFHIHTTFSDGRDTAEEIILAAIDRGIKKIGFSDHSYTFFDESYCIPKAKITEYRETLCRLRKKYRGKIEILIGIEQDFYSEEPTDVYDFVIGSVHYVKLGDEYIPIDESADILTEAAAKYFDGDIYRLIEEYFATVAKVAAKTSADVIGHFDLISKFNRGNALFDENDPRYTAAVLRAADALIPFGKPFEINTGAIARGYRDIPYPSAEIIDYISKKGGKFIFGSDSHSKETLCFAFGEYNSALAGKLEIVSSPI